MYVKRQPPDTTFATAKNGDNIYSTSDFRMAGSKQGIVYKNWKFIKADNKSVTLLYEEHYDFVKIQPDLKEELNYKYGEDYQIKIQGMVLIIYSLSNKEITYYIKSER
jgi:hypothetical protein